MAYAIIRSGGKQYRVSPGQTITVEKLAVERGQKVTFDGQFFRGSTDCIQEGSLTLKGSLTQPEFIFRFSNIAAVD